MSFDSKLKELKKTILDLCQKSDVVILGMLISDTHAEAIGSESPISWLDKEAPNMLEQAERVMNAHLMFGESLIAGVKETQDSVDRLM